MEDSKKIPLDLIDDPRIAMRDTVHDEKLDELVGDMRRAGLIEPIVVRPVGERYEIIAGHRRTTAARILRWASIPAVIKDVDDDTALLMRAMENNSRLDTNPVEEANYYGEIKLRMNKSDEELAELANRSVEWVRQRLAVFEMPDYLKVALQERRIPLGAALELAQINDENARREYTFYAKANGVSVATARRWKETLNSQQTWTPQQVQETLQNPDVYQPERKVVTCARCAGPCYLDRANLVYVHPNDCSPDAKGGLE